MLSWIIAILLVLPPGIILGNIPGKVDAPPESGFFADRGHAMVIVVVFPAIASFYPAWKASRLTVNEVLV